MYQFIYAFQKFFPTIHYLNVGAADCKCVCESTNGCNRPQFVPAGANGWRSHLSLRVSAERSAAGEIIK